MNAVRYGAHYGVNLDYCEEWFFADIPSTKKEDSGALIPTLRLVMGSGREVLYYGEQAQTMQRFLQSITPHA